MDVLPALDHSSSIVRRALRIREQMHLYHPVFEEREVARDSTRQDWSKVEIAPGSGMLLLCSSRSQKQ